MARAITIEELKAARDRYEKEIRALEEVDPNPHVGITAAQISRLIERLEGLRDQCTVMISSYGREGGIEHIANTRPTSEG
jgi:hypothetical protein